MKKPHLIGALCAVLFTFNTISANAALVSRLSGNAAWDDELGITWLTDASLSGSQSWAGQLSWIDSLNAENSGAGHLGFNDWRLASMSVAGGLPTGIRNSSDMIDCNSSSQADCEDNELGYMYMYNLGTITDANKSGTHTIGDVTLTGIQNFYWSGTRGGPVHYWTTSYTDGVQLRYTSDYNYYGWAVRAGDVGAVPIPAALWLFGSGLLGLVGIARRKKAA